MAGQDKSEGMDNIYKPLNFSFRTWNWVDGGLTLGVFLPLFIRIWYLFKS